MPACTCLSSCAPRASRLPGVLLAALLSACGGGDDVRVVERVEAPAQAVVLAGVGEPADSTGQDGYVNGARVGCQMYAEQYHVLKGSDGKTYYLLEIKIEGHDSAGPGNGYFTYYGAQPPAGTTLYVTGTCISADIRIAFFM